MRFLWSLLALLLLAAMWALRDPVVAVPEACEPPPWELLDQARQDAPGAMKVGGSSDGAGSTAEGSARRPTDPTGRADDVAPPTSPDSPASDRPVSDSATTPATPPAMPPGAGTERQPFRVSWDLLGRASGHVRGDGTLDAMPPTLVLLGGTWIELSGYYAPAIIAPSTNELVIMLNRWDGCCIGLPPTPYDSALVKTRAPVDFSLQHQFRFGTIRGRLVLEPFALGGLVLGLYRIEDAELLR
jgi:hypothetical protein